MLPVTLTQKALLFIHKDCVPFFKKVQLYTILYASVIWNTLVTLYKSWIIELNSIFHHVFNSTTFWVLLTGLCKSQTHRLNKIYLIFLLVLMPLQMTVKYCSPII